MRWLVTCHEGGSAPTGYGVYLRYPGYSLCMPMPFNVLARWVRGLWYKVKYPHNSQAFAGDVVEAYVMGWSDRTDAEFFARGETALKRSVIERDYWGKAIIVKHGLPQGKSSADLWDELERKERLLGLKSKWIVDKEVA